VLCLQSCKVSPPCPTYSYPARSYVATGKLHFSIHTLPDILIFHLQRLVISANGGGKIRTLVKFPLSQLNMQPFTTGTCCALIFAV
jgi:hypothetical protein